VSSYGLGSEVAADHFVTFSSSAGHSVKVLLDAAAIGLTGGHGGWEVIARPKRTSIVRWKGKDPYTMDVPIIFNGIGPYRNMEADIQTLIKMAEPTGHLKQPPTLKVLGAALPLLHSNRWWVIADMTWDTQNATWYRFGHITGRTRQSVVVHLLEYIDEQIIITQPSPAVLNSARGGDKVVKSSGLTAKQEAQKHYGNPSLFNIIMEANPWLPIDTRLGIKAGQDLIIPDPKTKKKK